MRVGSLSSDIGPSWLTLRAIVAALALLGIPGCRASDDSTLAVEGSDSAGLEVYEISGSIEDLPAIKLSEAVRAEISGSVEPYLADIGAVAWLSDGRIVIEDGQADEIHLFEGGGEYLSRLGTRGDGPGEFQRISTLSVGAGDTLYAYDQHHGRISVLHPDTGFVRSVSFAIAPDDRSPGEVWKLRAGYVSSTQRSGASVGGAFPQRVPREGSLTLHHESGESVGDPLIVSAGFSIVTEDTEIYAAYTNQPVVAVSSGRVAHSSAQRYSITLSDQQLNPRRRILWPEGDAPIRESEVDSVRQVIQAWYAEAGAPNRAETLANSILAIIPDTRPPFGRVLIDERQRLWLEHFEPDAPGWHEPRSWHVLDRTATAVGRLELPPATSLLSVSGNEVMLSVLDSLDVPSIQIREIVPD